MSKGVGQEGFHEIYRAELDYVWATLRKLGAPASELEDLTHDVFATVLKKQRDYDPTRPVRPWLFGIAFRVWVGHRRKSRAVSGEAPEVWDERTPESTLSSRQQWALFWAALQSVEQNRRAVFLMHDVDGHTMPQIVEAMEIPLNTAYSRLRLARQELAQAVRTLSRETSHD